MKIFQCLLFVLCFLGQAIGQLPDTTTTSPIITDTTTTLEVPTSSITYTTTLGITSSSVNTSVALKCTKFGQSFPDYNDCGSYYVCLNDSCGNIHPAAYACDAVNANYDPVQQICTSKPVSNCNNNLTIPECQIGDSSVPDPTDTKRYYLCIQAIQTKLIKIHRFCPPNLVFDDNMKLCICNNTVPKYCNVSMTYPNEDETNCFDESELDDPPFYEGFECQKPGIFADGYDCNRYYVCVIEKCGTLVKYGLNCPKNMMFDAKRKVCCADPATKCVCTCRSDTFNCINPGLFPDVNCPSQFYECYMDNFLTFIKKRLACPDGTYYNPKCQACTDSPIDKCKSLQDEEEEDNDNSSDSSFDSKPTDSLCKGMHGRYPIKGEPDCFYYCKDGALTKEKCPSKCIFDRHKKTCIPKKEETVKKSSLKQIRFNINIGSLE